MFLRKLILGVLWNTAIYGAVLFVPAGTFRWWRAWVFLGVLNVLTIATMVGVMRTRPGLLKERYKGLVQKGQPRIDRVLVLTFVASYMGSLIFIPLDVFEFHLLPRPSLWVSSLGLVLIVVGWVIISLVFRENAFAAPVVRHQTEREHTVVDTGVYSIVRHPMYLGIFVFNIGIALWLESYAGALVAIVPIGLLAVRILFEERFLRRHLPGYEIYTTRVRYRLIPFLW
jgi:protein-S-isoprenylcysteine O-methyltransferase Ste14